jgi:hypothetical protein
MRFALSPGLTQGCPVERRRLRNDGARRDRSEALAFDALHALACRHASFALSRSPDPQERCAAWIASGPHSDRLAEEFPDLAAWHVGILAGSFTPTRRVSSQRPGRARGYEAITFGLTKLRYFIYLHNLFNLSVENSDDESFFLQIQGTPFI